jgi:parallel beta-helix repeat protein
MRGMAPKRVGLVAAVAGVALTLVAVPAHGASPSCGDVLTQSVELQSDLICSDPDPVGLVIGADGVTIDLGGHSIEGAQLAIDATGGYDDVTVRNGSLQNNTEGIRLASVSGARVSRMMVRGGFAAIRADDGDHLQVSRVDACADYDPLSLRFESDDVVRDSTFCDGMLFAISIFGSQRITFESNDVSGPRNGVRLEDTHNSVVSANKVSDSHEVGISVGSGSGNLIERNRAVRNTQGITVELGAVSTQVRKNSASFNVAEPFLSFLTRDGIGVYDPSTVLADNVANRNFGFGINAPNGAIDAGGNHAHGNGAGQCVNVAC